MDIMVSNQDQEIHSKPWQYLCVKKQGDYFIKRDTLLQKCRKRFHVAVVQDESNKMGAGL